MDLMSQCWHRKKAPSLVQALKAPACIHQHGDCRIHAA